MRAPCLPPTADKHRSVEASRVCAPHAASNVHNPKQRLGGWYSPGSGSFRYRANGRQYRWRNIDLYPHPRALPNSTDHTRRTGFPTLRPSFPRAFSLPKRASVLFPDCYPPCHSRLKPYPLRRSVNGYGMVRRLTGSVAVACHPFRMICRSDLGRPTMQPPPFATSLRSSAMASRVRLPSSSGEPINRR